MGLLSARDLRSRRAALGGLLVLITVLVYAPVVHHGFLKLWDDDAYVTDNPHVRSGLNFTNIRWAFSSFEQSNWHPVTWLSHMLDCQLFGMNAGPQHAVNLLLHAANVLLLFWILQQATGAVGRSFVVAALFAVHPLNVETVAWIAQRKSLLSAFFSLLMLAAYGWYLRRPGWKRYLLIITAFALALMAKPMAVSLPLLLLLFDYWPLQRDEQLPFWQRGRRLTLEKLPLFAMSAASSVVTELAQSSGGSVMKVSLLPISARMENAAISYVAYMGKLLWPTQLAGYYPIRLSPPLGDAIASAAIVIGISTLALYFRKFPYLAVGWFFYLLTLVPVIGIVQVGFQGMADRYMYVPAIGLFIAMVWGIGGAIESVASAQAVFAFAAVIVVAGLSVTTEHYLSYWKDNVTLFAHARIAWGQPDMWLEQLYGDALFSSGRIDEALQHFEASCAIQPRTEYCHYNIAHILLGRGEAAAALREYQLALRFTASRDMALLCLTEGGEAELLLGDYAGAQRSAEQALTIDPRNEAALQLRKRIIRLGGAN